MPEPDTAAATPYEPPEAEEVDASMACETGSMIVIGSPPS